MIHFYTSKKAIPSNIELHEDIESTFLIKTRKPNIIYFNNEVSNQLLHDIDGVTQRDGNVITNKFGKSPLTNVSTGCKGALLAVNFSSICISNLELGDNTIIALLKISKNYDIHIIIDDELEYNILEAGSDMQVTLDNQKCTLREACIQVYDLLNPDDDD